MKRMSPSKARFQARQIKHLRETVHMWSDDALNRVSKMLTDEFINGRSTFPGVPRGLLNKEKK